MIRCCAVLCRRAQALFCVDMRKRLACCHAPNTNAHTRRGLQPKTNICTLQNHRCWTAQHDDDALNALHTQHALRVSVTNRAVMWTVFGRKSAGSTPSTAQQKRALRSHNYQHDSAAAAAHKSSHKCRVINKLHPHRRSNVCNWTRGIMRLKLYDAHTQQITCCLHTTMHAVCAPSTGLLHKTPDTTCTSIVR